MLSLSITTSPIGTPAFNAALAPVSCLQALLPPSSTSTTSRFAHVSSGMYKRQAAWA